MLEIADLYVGYYRDLNILQGVNLTAESGQNHHDSGRQRRGQIDHAQGHLWLS